MLYHPASGRILDCWLFESQGTYYLYYLHDFFKPEGGVGLATSTNLLDWTEVGIVIRKRDDATWLGSGAVWKASDFEQSGRYIMNFSEWMGDKVNGQQVIRFAESTDLRHWSRLEESHDFYPDTRWYNINQGNQSRWDCIYAVPKAHETNDHRQGYYGYWSATPTEDESWIGFGESEDGIHWRCLPPARIEWGAVEPFRRPHELGATYDLGAVEVINGTWYAMINSWGNARPLNGSFLFTAPAPEGPFVPAASNFELIVSRNQHSRTFPRFFRNLNLPGNPEIWMVHLTKGRDKEKSQSFAPVKTVSMDDAHQPDRFSLRYWQGNEGLKRSRIDCVPTPSENQEGLSFLSTILDLQKGLIVEGLFECTLSRAGIYLEHNADQGSVLMLNPNGLLEIGTAAADLSHLEVENTIDGKRFPEQAHPFRLLLRNTQAELYLHDELAAIYSLSQHCTGRIAFIQAREVHVWCMDRSDARSHHHAALFDDETIQM